MGSAVKKDAVEEFHENRLSFGVLPHASNDPLYYSLASIHIEHDPVHRAEEDANMGSCKIRNDGSAWLVHHHGRLDPHMTEAEKKAEEAEEKAWHREHVIHALCLDIAEQAAERIEGFFAGDPIYTDTGTKLVPYYNEKGDNLYYDDGLTCLVNIPKNTTTVQQSPASLAPTIENVEAANSSFTFNSDGQVSLKPLVSQDNTESDALLEMTNLNLTGPKSTHISAITPLIDTPVSNTATAPDERDAQVAGWATRVAETKSDITAKSDAPAPPAPTAKPEGPMEIVIEGGADVAANFIPKQQQTFGQQKFGLNF